MKERTQFERFDLELPARIEVETPGRKTEPFSLKTTNISADGAFFRTPKPLSKGTKVKLNLILEIEKLKKLTGSLCHIKVRGTVVRSDEKDMAVRFQQNWKMIPFQV